MSEITDKRNPCCTASQPRTSRFERTFVDRCIYLAGACDDIDWRIEHLEARLAELMAKGAHKTHPWITERYENDLNRLYKGCHAKQAVKK